MRQMRAPTRAAVGGIRGAKVSRGRPPVGLAGFNGNNNIIATCTRVPAKAQQLSGSQSACKGAADLLRAALD